MNPDHMNLHDECDEMSRANHIIGNVLVGVLTVAIVGLMLLFFVGGGGAQIVKKVAHQWEQAQ